MIPSALAGHFPDLPYPDLPPLASRPRLVSHMDDVEDVRTAIFAALPGSLRDVTASVFGGVSQAALTRIGNALRTMAQHGWVRVEGHAAHARWVAAVAAVPPTEKRVTIIDKCLAVLADGLPRTAQELATLLGLARPTVSDQICQAGKRGLVRLIHGRKWQLP